MRTSISRIPIGFPNNIRNPGLPAYLFERAYDINPGQLLFWFDLPSIGSGEVSLGILCVLGPSESTLGANSPYRVVPIVSPGV